MNIRVVRRATEKAIQVVLGEWPYLIKWIPRSQIRGGADVMAGERDISLAVSDWFMEKLMEEIDEEG